jgi:hypothetical protein
MLSQAAFQWNSVNLVSSSGTLESEMSILSYLERSIRHMFFKLYKFQTKRNG